MVLGLLLRTPRWWPSSELVGQSDSLTYFIYLYSRDDEILNSDGICFFNMYLNLLIHMIFFRKTTLRFVSCFSQFQMSYWVNSGLFWQFSKFRIIDMHILICFLYFCTFAGSVSILRKSAIQPPFTSSKQDPRLGHHLCHHGAR